MLKKSLFPNSSPLFWYEKLIAYLFIFLLIFITKYALNVPDERWPKSRFKNAPNEQIVIEISGEVAEPGRYHFNRGTTLKAALESAPLTDDATLKGLKLDQPLKCGQKVKIKKNKKK